MDYVEEQIHAGGIGPFHSQRLPAQIKDRLDNMLLVNARQTAVIFQHPKRETGPIRGLECNRMKRKVIGPPNDARPMIKDLRLFRRQELNHFAAEEQPADDSVVFAQEQRFQRYVVALGHGDGSGRGQATT